MILSENNILVPNKISLPYPFSMNRALPIDARSFFTSFEEAEEAVRYAVELERDENGYFILPPEIPEDTNENGGVDSEYYYGQTIVVTSENGQKADIYVVVKRYDLEGRVYGELQIPNSDFFSQYLSEEEIALLAQRMIGEYIHNNLNVDCINDYIFTNELDSCGNEIPSNGLYAYGLKEVDGKIELCDYAKKVLAFDPDTPYDKDTNPIATLDSIRGRLAEVWKELNKKVDKIPGYGLSQNDFTDCLLDKLMSLPTIQLEGDNKLIINGRAFRLTEWYDIFDYYVG
ncbi:MAG: hypothetical protein J6X18_11610 [Bacteroidales bacterium]|nr:hypothetical protein [Bacteroidales bacterium]